MKRIVLASLLLAGCAHTPSEPGIDVRTVTVEKPVAVACIDREAVPREPAQVGSKLNGNAAHDADLLAGSALTLRQWGRELRALITPCIAKP